MTILFVRHASAGERKRWKGDDRLRPLDARGRRQAEGLVDLLRRHGPSRVLSSSSVRCRETVEPLARDLGLTVEERGELAEGASADEVHSVAAKLAEEVVVLCTHGDVVAEVLGEESEKGSTWVFRFDGDVLTPIEYLPPPA
ncbi:MAG: SixA phosphatase family protein [Gaiellaceae bacterium]